MRVRSLFLHIGIVLIAALALSPLASAKTPASSKKTASKAHSSKTKSVAAHSTSKHRKGKKYASKKKSSWKSRGQKTIASDRTREIQEALIREHYLTGEADGRWDDRTQTAMRRFQAEQGWQTKVLPDSRALIKLGLGPDHSDVLNPETAATSPYLPGGGEKSSEMNTIVPATAVIRR